MAAALLFVPFASPCRAEDPPPTYSTRMVWDEARGEIVMFGSIILDPADGKTKDSNDTWVWRGAGWIKKNPEHRPSLRGVPGMAYDAACRKVIVFGGFTGASAEHLDDTWAWDGEDWQELITPVHPPKGRGANLLYDDARREVVLFGGHSTQSGELFQDTWVGNCAEWVKRLPNTSPPARTRFNWAYDSSRAEVVLFGGSGSSSGDGRASFRDTWVWDGLNWIPRSPMNPPPALSGSAIAYDSIREEVVMFGGKTANGDASNETWSWDGASWNVRSPATVPSVRDEPTAAFDPIRGVVVMFGGHPITPSIPNNETWLWDGANWKQYAPPPMITLPLTDHTVAPGQDVTLTIDVTGAEPLTYRWTFNEQEIADEKTASLTVADVGCAHAGLYTVTVSNAEGSATSSARLSLLGLQMYAGLTICGNVGAEYQVEWMPAVGGTEPWKPLATFPLPSNPYLFIDSESPNVPQRFYRAFPK